MDATKKGHSHRLRTGRYSESGRIYLVTATTNHRWPWFSDLTHARIVVRALKYQSATRRANSLAFVVMPDHIHWLVQLPESASLSRVMQQVKGYSGRQILKLSGAKGPVWQDGFHDHALRSEEDLKGIARYIIANPLRAGLVTRIGDYPLWDAVWL